MEAGQEELKFEDKLHDADYEKIKKELHHKFDNLNEYIDCFSSRILQHVRE